MSSKKANHTVKKAFEESFDATVNTLPLADGGEGTIDALKDVLKGTLHFEKTHDSLMRTLKSRYLTFEKDSALLELAETAGLSLLNPDEQTPLETSTYGVGEQFKSAVDNGAKHVYIGIGGSATNDGGIGFLNALGVIFLDKQGEALTPKGASLKRIHSIENTETLNRYKDVSITLLCDVNNPLTGKNGAARVYGPQKGASEKDVAFLEEGLNHYADLLNVSKATRALPGMGAAGGVALSLKHFFPTDIKSGFEVIRELTHLDGIIEASDLIITGEGAIDGSSLNDKGPFKLAKLAHEKRKTVIAFTGAFNDQKRRALYPFDAIFPINLSPVKLEEALISKTAERSLHSTAGEVAKLLKEMP